jgi:trehalose-6-phosphate synthase
LLVNPYDVDEMADSIRRAFTMKPEEQRLRMGRMREILQESNVYGWAADLVTELGRIRPMEKKSTASLSP